LHPSTNLILVARRCFTPAQVRFSASISCGNGEKNISTIE
jgi:hypothetical protein